MKISFKLLAVASLFSTLPLMADFTFGKVFEKEQETPKVEQKYSIDSLFGNKEASDTAAEVSAHEESADAPTMHTLTEAEYQEYMRLKEECGKH